MGPEGLGGGGYQDPSGLTTQKHFVFFCASSPRDHDYETQKSKNKVLPSRDARDPNDSQTQERKNNYYY